MRRHLRSCGIDVQQLQKPPGPRSGETLGWYHAENYRLFKDGIILRLTED